MYSIGFGNHHASEAIPGALPTAQNSPQQCPLGLYTEQLSGSAFTRPRHLNLHSWLYRILPSVVHQDYEIYPHVINDTFAPLQAPNPMRWSPRTTPLVDQDFIDGLIHIAGSTRLNTYLYQCNQSMTTRYFSNSDGELLFVPYEGRICLRTELGLLTLSPGMIAVVPRGIKFKVELLEPSAAGYVCENAGLSLRLPELGTMGANALANPRHFLYPTAAFEIMDVTMHPKICREEDPMNRMSRLPQNSDIHLICKYQHQLWIAKSNHSPLNVVAWHGNYAPYCYDLALFNTINTVSFDHPDPSIFTVLTSESPILGIANLDFVIFPSRWMVAEHTFRPPYFHRNIMNEFMGLVSGNYDAKKAGFTIGGISIHNCMTAHGPDEETYVTACEQTLKPQHYPNTLAFMFESQEPWLITNKALNHPSRQKEYSACWQKLKPTV